MTAHILLVSDIIESNGKTVRENNLALQHEIPLGALVEIESDDKEGVRLFVVNHSRDCDGTPLYDLSFNKEAQKSWQEATTENEKATGMDRKLTSWFITLTNGSILRHYGASSLREIKLK